jgi:hypothetical protein
MTHGCGAQLHLVARVLAAYSIGQTWTCWEYWQSDTFGEVATYAHTQKSQHVMTHVGREKMLENVYPVDDKGTGDQVGKSHFFTINPHECGAMRDQVQKSLLRINVESGIIRYSVGRVSRGSQCDSEWTPSWPNDSSCQDRPLCLC